MLKKTKREVNMLSGSISRGLLTISIPIMLMNVIQSLFNIIDMSVLKSYDTGGGSAVGAVGACTTLISVITSLVIGASSGSNVSIAKAIGRQDRAEVSRCVRSAMAISIAGGFFISIIGLVFARVFLTMINCPPELIAESTLYFRLYFAGVPILMVYNFCASIMRSTGDSRRPMLFLTAGGIIKVILTYLFIAKFQMGVAGVAAATIISWLVSAFLGLHSLISGDSIVRFRPKEIRFFKTEVKEILRIGIPVGLQQALYSVANLIIVATVNSFGAKATTGISIANTFDGILYQISTATALAVMPYVSQNVGNKNMRRAVQSVGRGVLITVALGAGFGALSAIFSPQLSSIMSSDPEVIAFSCQKMVIISSTYFICGINEIMNAALRGMGRPLPPTWCTFIYMCILRFVWVFWIFPLLPNLTFLYLVWPLGWTLAIITNLLFYFPTVRKLKAQFAS